jgi:hypothetical protein
MSSGRIIADTFSHSADNAFFRVATFVVFNAVDLDGSAMRMGLAGLQIQRIGGCRHTAGAEYRLTLQLRRDGSQSTAQRNRELQVAQGDSKTMNWWRPGSIDIVRLP